MTAGPGSPTRGTSYGWRLGSLYGIPVYLGRSWPIIALVIVVTFGPQVRQSTGASGGAFGYAVAVAYAVLLLFSVLAHEAAHALVARRFRYEVDRVVADLWGGHTVYDTSTSRPGASAAIAVSGPLANLAIAGVGYALVTLVSPDGVAGLLLGAVMVTNLFVGVFNLLPGLPLDGGFLVDALVWRVTGDRNKGLIVAGWLGRVLTVLVVLWLVGRPLLMGDPPSLFTIVWCGLIGAFLWAGASNAIKSGTARRAISRVPLTSVLRPALVVSTRDPLASVLAVLTTVDGTSAGGRDDGAAGRWPGGAGTGGVRPLVVAIGPDHRPMGLVDVEAARAVDPARWHQVPVEAVVGRQPDGWVVEVPSRDVDVSGVVASVVGRGSVPPTMVAVTPQGEVLGTVTLTDLNAAFTG
ncbi:MAG: site-2 protease family protein [Lapillicoccus sp.]